MMFGAFIVALLTYMDRKKK
ncbi:MAG: putative holin-like toxin [Bacillota bacterium]